MDPNIDWKGIAGTVLGILKAKLSGYLKDHADAERFLEDCAEQVAKLTLKAAIPGMTPDQAKDVDDEIAAYKSAMLLEADAVILDAEGAAKSTFVAVLETALDVAVKVAPLLLKFV